MQSAGLQLRLPRVEGLGLHWVSGCDIIDFYMDSFKGQSSLLGSPHTNGGDGTFSEILPCLALHFRSLPEELF